jgi:hypothetical protein
MNLQLSNLSPFSTFFLNQHPSYRVHLWSPKTEITNPSFLTSSHGMTRLSNVVTVDTPGRPMMSGPLCTTSRCRYVTLWQPAWQHDTKIAGACRTDPADMRMSLGMYLDSLQSVYVFSPLHVINSRESSSNPLSLDYRRPKRSAHLTSRHCDVTFKRTRSRNPRGLGMHALMRCTNKSVTALKTIQSICIGARPT